MIFDFSVIRQLCERAAANFNYDLDACYLGYEGRRSNHPTERNATIHLVSAFSPDFHVYAEVGQNTRSSSRCHYDLVMLRKHQNFADQDAATMSADFLVCECKRLYGTEQVGGIAGDLERIRAFEYPIEDNIAYRKKGTAFGLLCIINWSDERVLSPVVKSWNERKLCSGVSEDSPLGKFFKEAKKMAGDAISQDQMFSVNLAASRLPGHNVGQYTDVFGQMLFFVFRIPEKS